MQILNYAGILSTLLILARISYAQNCLIIPGHERDKLHHAPIPQEVVSLYSSSFDMSNLYEYFFISGGTNLNISTIVVDTLGNYDYSRYENGVLNFSYKGIIMDLSHGSSNNLFILNETWNIVCPYLGGLSSAGSQILFVRAKDGEIVIKSNMGELIQTLRNHKEFFCIPVRLYDLSVEIVQKRLKSQRK